MQWYAGFLISGFQIMKFHVLIFGLKVRISKHKSLEIKVCLNILTKIPEFEAFKS